MFGKMSKISKKNMKFFRKNISKTDRNEVGDITSFCLYKLR